jgi:hypothetical protein
LGLFSERFTVTETRQHVVEQLEKHQETMRLDDFVRFIEIDHPTDGPGVNRETLADYAEAVYFDVDLSAVDDRLVDNDEWVEGDHLYEVGENRISVYPPDWHDALSEAGEIRDVLEVIQAEVTQPEGDSREAVTEERGVPEEKLLRVSKAVAGIDRDRAREELKRLRENDEIQEFASQHRNPSIRLR